MLYKSDPKSLLGLVAPHDIVHFLSWGLSNASGALELHDLGSNLGSDTYGFAAWDQLLNVSGSQFPLLKNGNNDGAR